MKLIREPLVATFLIAALVVVGCGDDKGADKSQNLPSEEEELDPAVSGDPVEIFLDSLRAFNEGNLEELLGTLSRDTVWHEPCVSRPPARGRKAVARQMVGFKGMLPDATIGVRRIIVKGDILVAQASLTATQKWDKQGIERKVPRRVGYEMLYFVQAPDGPATATLVYSDLATARRQLGHMKGDLPPVASLPEGEPEIVKEGSGGDRDKIVARLFEVLGSANLDDIDPMLAEGFVFRDVDDGANIDAGAFKARHLKAMEGMSEISYKVREVVGVGKYAAAHWVMQAVHTDGDGPARRIKLHGAHFFTFEGEKVARMEAYDSSMELIEQLGLVESFRKPADALLPPVIEEAPADAGVAANK